MHERLLFASYCYRLRENLPDLKKSGISLNTLSVLEKKMSEKKLPIVLGIINILALAGIVFWYVGRDHEPPIISVEEEIVYEEEMTDSDLVLGVSAVDGKDGDVSDTLVIEKVAVNHDKGIAVVTCGANDASGNIAKMAFRMEMSEPDGSSADTIVSPLPNNNPSADESAGEVFTLAAGEAANGEEGEGTHDAQQNSAAVDSGEEASDGQADGTDEDSVNNAEAEENVEDDSEENAEGEADSEEDIDGNENGEDLNEDGESTSEHENEVQQQTPAQNNPQPEVSEAPVLAFGAPEVVTTKGKNPAWVTVISQLQDNKDSYEYLLGNLRIAGDFTNANVGSYDVMVSTVDSDGNESAARPMRITVTE